MKIGSIFDQTSTTEFVVMLDHKYDNENLLFSYLEISPDGGNPNPDGERIVARITSLHKENPLLSRDQAGVSAAIDVGGLGYAFSRRFTYGWAQCTVVGTVVRGRLDMNRRVIAPNAEVHTPSAGTLRQLFFKPNPSFIPLGTIETFGESGISEVPITLDADQLVTKHFCIFGMTGSGKTNTSAKVIEELMARRHRMIIFDSHDDYSNLEVFTDLFNERDEQGNITDIPKPAEHLDAVQEAIRQISPTASDGRPVDDCVYERLLRVSSVILNNTPARQLVKEASDKINQALVSEIAANDLLKRSLAHSQVVSRNFFPQLKFYGNGFEDYTVHIFEGFLGEPFTAAQWRWLRDNISTAGTGTAYINNLISILNVDTQVNDATRDALRQKLQGLRAIFLDAQRNSNPIEIDVLFNGIAVRASAADSTVYRFSLTDLSSNMRKTMVYAVVTYFFRSFKFGGFHATAKNGNPANAYPMFFVLEEARSLIPRSSGIDDVDMAGRLARIAMREIAYEGRKFSLGFGLISQKPSTIDPEVVSQANTFIVHQLKSPDDQQYVRAVTESMSQEELEMIKSLGTGRAIVAGVAIQSPIIIRVFIRYIREGIQEPTPIKDELTSLMQVREKIGVN
jgi:DNA helicase HerA-like ATPase